jgi:hypothetical protein
METPTVSSARKMNRRAPILAARWPLTSTETRYPRKLAVLMNPICE